MWPLTLKIIFPCSLILQPVNLSNKELIWSGLIVAGSQLSLHHCYLPAKVCKYCSVINCLCEWFWHGKNGCTNSLPPTLPPSLILGFEGRYSETNLVSILQVQAVFICLDVTRWRFQVCNLAQMCCWVLLVAQHPLSVFFAGCHGDVAMHRSSNQTSPLYVVWLLLACTHLCVADLHRKKWPAKIFCGLSARVIVCMCENYGNFNSKTYFSLMER